MRKPKETGSKGKKEQRLGDKSDEPHADSSCRRTRRVVGDVLDTPGEPVGVGAGVSVMMGTWTTGLGDVCCSCCCWRGRPTIELWGAVDMGLADGKNERAEKSAIEADEWIRRPRVRMSKTRTLRCRARARAKGDLFGRYE
jgi:hypothetical protein